MQQPRAPIGALGSEEGRSGIRVSVVAGGGATERLGACAGEERDGFTFFFAMLRYGRWIWRRGVCSRVSRGCCWRSSASREELLESGLADTLAVEAAKGFLAVLRSYLDLLCSNLRSHTITNVQSNDDKADLVGVYYDTDNSVKFGFSMAFSMTLLSWIIIKFGEKMATTTSNTMDAVRWGTNYLLKAIAEPNKIHVQVGDPYGDHNGWERPEDMDTPQTVYIRRHKAWFGGCWAKTIS